jgi:chaperonin cofactor prefoldin
MSSSITENKEKAEASKSLGNAAFGSKEYDSSITHYSLSIKLDPSNHVYWSNRSASYAAKREWGASLTDALECVKLCPGFIKGYYRLVAAQVELGDFEGAQNTVRAGLTLDAANPELTKQLRVIKAKKAQAEAQKAKAQTGGGGVMRGSRGAVGERDAKEALDLQDNMQSTRREISEVVQYIGKSQREQKMTDLTLVELEGIPLETPMYRSVGKMFMISNKKEVLSLMVSGNGKEKKKEKELKSKKDYLEKKFTGQMGNYTELTGQGQGQASR